MAFLIGNQKEEEEGTHEGNTAGDGGEDQQAAL